MAISDSARAQGLRTALNQAAIAATQNGNIDREWVNEGLAQLGVKTVPGKSEYKIGVPVFGHYGRVITAGSRAEAEKIFREQHLARIIGDGEIGHTSNDAVYGIEINPDAPVTFHDGPEDPADVDALDLSVPELENAIRSFLKSAVAARGWGHSHANSTLKTMGLDPLPELEMRPVVVAVTGTTKVIVRAFKGDDDAITGQTAQHVLEKAGYTSIQLEEVGEMVKVEKADDEPIF
jgi:hypothetical protein